MVSFSAFILLLFNGIALAPPPNDHPKRSTPAETPNNSTHLAKLRQPSGNLSVPNVNCNGDQFRHDLEYPSCADALFLIPNDDRQLRFAPHHSTLDFDMPLPFRWISGDGICIIDILKGTAHPLGIASFNELYDAAYWIIHECVMGDEVGGRAVNIGPQQNMALRVTSYRPLVHCSDDAGPPPQACQSLIQRMPSTGSSPSAPKIIFGEAGDPDVQVGLPYTITEPSGQCEATITTVRGLSDTAKWYEIWEGLIAVAGMCVRAGYAGLGFHRGTRGYLTVTLTKGRAARGVVSEE